MAFLDWIKERVNVTPKVSEADRKLFAEWRQDYRLAKQRDETGREPESGPPESAPATKPTTPRKPPSWER